MKFWMKYRRGTSASAGRWEWKMLWALTKEEADEEAQSFTSELNDSYYWSEHHRGVEWHVTTEAPKHVVAHEIENAAQQFEAVQEKLKRLHTEIGTAEECECHSGGSCYCEVCGRLIKK